VRACCSCVLFLSCLARLSAGLNLQLKSLKSPYAAEQASKAFAAQAREQFDKSPSMQELSASFSLSYGSRRVFKEQSGGEMCG
jgi:hypothetical protein